MHYVFSMLLKYCQCTISFFVINYYASYSSVQKYSICFTRNDKVIIFPFSISRSTGWSKLCSIIFSCSLRKISSCCYSTKLLDEFKSNNQVSDLGVTHFSLIHFPPFPVNQSEPSVSQSSVRHLLHLFLV